MATISSRWFTPNVLLLLLLLFLLLAPYGSCQRTPPPVPQTKTNDPVVIVVTVLFFVIFVIVFGSIFCRRNNASFSTRPSVFRRAGQDQEDQVARIRRNTAARGLDEETVDSFPTFSYSEVKVVKIGKGGDQCAVCLCEFQDDETLRLMPPCCHVFHVDCVDVWLSDHSTCPLCRADLKAKSVDEIESSLVTDPERQVLESSDRHLLEGVTSTTSNITPRSKSTGLSMGWFNKPEVPAGRRSYSTGHGHSFVQPTGDLNRFTLTLPDEVRRHLMKTRTVRNVTLPQARSSRSGFRSGSVGSERGLFSHGGKIRNFNRRLHSLSFSFSFRSGSVRSTSSGGDAIAPPKNLSPTFEYGERSSERLRPDDRV